MASSLRISKRRASQLMQLQDPPDGGWAWVVVIGATFAMTQLQSLMRCYSVFYLPLIDEFSAGYSQVSALTAMGQLGVGVAGLVLPPLVTKIDYRQCVMGAGFIAAACAFLSSFATQLWQILLLTGVICGLCIGVSLSGSMVVVTRYFYKMRNRATQVCCGVASIGVLLSSPLYQILIDTYTWRGAFQIIGGIFLQLVLVGTVLRPIVLREDFTKEILTKYKLSLANQTKLGKTLDSNNNNAPYEIVHNNETNFIGDDTTSTASTCDLGEQMSSGLQQRDKTYFAQIKKQIEKVHLDIFFNPAFYVYVLCWTSYSIAYHLVPTYLIPLGKQVAELSEIEASTLVSAIMCGELITRLFYGILFDKFSQQRRVLYCAFMKILLGGALCLIPFLKSYVGMLVGSGLLGVVGGGMDGIYTVFAVELFGIQKTPALFGFGNVFIYGILAGITVALDATGNLSSVFYIGGASGLLSFGLALWMGRIMAHQRQKAKDAEMEEKNLANL
ncbi:unnamed protein product [Clavelina lepadiformis]|uniref:Major facilitator superfamily (MFS) profile domain-containing protein n=1 Tax=Clavelina lepadiformis TaxID=159417 RepID=A0ABP0F776_CLALP